MPLLLVLIMPLHKNQVICNVNCRLLEKWRNLKNGFDLEMKSDKGIQKKGRNPVTCNKNSEVSTERESLQ
jgi:hypothetical protein